jgi:quercetin dioxygenase-like cupin family protein
MTSGIEDPSEGLDTRLTRELAADLRPVALDDETRARLWRRVSRRIAENTPAGTVTLRNREDVWISLGPLVKCRRLRVDPVAGNQTVLVRALPGASLPRHRHSQEEEFIVLEGECYIGTHHLRAGDAHFAAAGSWHDDVTTRTGVLVLIRGEYPAPSHP